MLKILPDTVAPKFPKGYRYVTIKVLCSNKQLSSRAIKMML